MPLVVAGDLGRLELGPLAVLDLVDAEIVLERVVPRDVIILRVHGPPDEAAAAIELAGDGFELHAKVNVFVARSLHQSDVKRGIVVPGFLVEDTIFAVAGDFPLADLVGKAAGDLAGLVLLEVPGCLGGIWSRRRAAAQRTR